MTRAGVSNSNHDTPIRGTSRRNRRQESLQTEVLDTTMRVTTPENISFQYQIAGPFRRIYAYLLDILISIVGYWTFVFLVYLLFVLAAFPLAQMIGGLIIVETVAAVLTGLSILGYFLVYWFYGAYYETYFNGQTIGKRITKMRVISVDGHAIDGVQATLRNFFRLLDIMPLVPISALFQLDIAMPGMIPTCLVGLLIMTITPKFQRVGDLVANTVVVNEEKARQPELAEFSDPRVIQLAEEIPTSYVVSASMSRALADYVDHRDFLAFQRASEIASHVAIPLLKEFGLPDDTDYDLFLCALYYKTFSDTKNGQSDTPLRKPDDIQTGESAPSTAEHAIGVRPGNLDIDLTDVRINTD